MPYQKTEFENALHGHMLVLFLGADLPREVTGLPSRADLARDLARRYGFIGQDATLPYSLAEVASRVSQAGNRFEFTDFIRNALDTVGKSPSAFHQGLAALVKEHGIKTIITTAYDNLLEVAFQQAGVGFWPVVRGNAASFIKPDLLTLIYLYGKADQVDTLVVTDRDHSQLLRDRDKEDLIAEVRQAFRRNTLLFYGYNLSDPDFKFLFDDIAESKFARLAYAVWPGLSEVDVRMWRDRGIVILEEDPLGVLNGSTVESARPSASAEVKVPVASAGAGRASSTAATVNTVSGGVNITSGETHVGGDVVGRDKIVDQSTHGDVYHITIQHADNLAIGSGASVTSTRASKSADTASAERASLQYQLDQARENLRLVEEHISQYVMQTDVNLQYVKQQRQWQARIAELESKLGHA